MLDLNSNIQFLKGVGEQRGKKYEKLGIRTVCDLLYHFPRSYVDLSAPFTVSSAPFDGIVPIKAILTYKSKEQRIRKGLSIFKLIASDETGQLEISIFNNKYLVDSLKIDEEYFFYGRIDGSFSKKKITAPNIYPVNQNYSILPIYNQTSGISSNLIRKNVSQCLSEIESLIDPIPEKYRIKYNLLEITKALKDIHFPDNIKIASLSRNRFIFEELLTLSCALYSLRSEKVKSINKPFDNIDLSPFYENLPYSPTNAQLRCISDSVEDMTSETPMNRLIQGDVGSGKTLVAAACIYVAYKNNFQSSLMVPTEILAEQHYNTLKTLLEPLGVKVSLLTGSTKASEKKEILNRITNGDINLCIGTHALLSDNISYSKLGLVITDEQHRFGVAQRNKLSQKSNNVNVLVMSATPIPRTLSLIIYGDLSVSLVDEMPPGRQPVETLVINSSKLSRAMGFVRKNLDEGKQAYIVCPLIEVGEIDTGLKPAIDYFNQLSEGEFKKYKVGLLHGKMKSSEKEKTMKNFKSGIINLLVSTTVVEVGVDVPNATIMMIENAERFGLSQLHQLRGRVGRGKEKSFCILVSDSRSELARERLNAMKSISNGFKLAEYDLKLRGPGDFFGYRQHGLPTLKVADLAENIDIMQEAQACAKEILSEDSLLKEPIHKSLKNNVDKMIITVGERPN